LKEPTVIKYLKKAKKDGWIIVQQHGYGDCRWRRNEYTASLPERVVKEINHSSKGGKTDTKGGKTDTKGWLNSHKRVVKEVNPISSYISYNNSSKNSGKIENEKTNLERMQELFPQEPEMRRG